VMLVNSEGVVQGPVPLMLLFVSSGISPIRCNSTVILMEKVFQVVVRVRGREGGGGGGGGRSVGVVDLTKGGWFPSQPSTIVYFICSSYIHPSIHTY